MGSRVDRTLTLPEPLALEALWHQLALALPSLVRFFVLQAYAHADDPPQLVSGRPALHGPDGNRYSVSEAGVHGHTDLFTVERDGHRYRSIILTIISATISRGLIVLTLSSDAREVIDHLSLEVDPDHIDEVVTLLTRAQVPCSVKPRGAATTTGE